LLIIDKDDTILENFEQLLQFAKDENFKKFLSHPKVQKLMSDETFKKAVVEKNIFKLMSNEEFVTLLKDPEVREALEKLSRKFKNDTK
jgi:F0F1-type ATP synthase delta subunit